ncbi:hypothetical protein HHI36_017155 [Cryptolaemus montrouzieri]|uniref:Uncharacterized protein n=1 Tax=Cryptolaemus montrouzieri TaxID=559131 RepID=A0ABD2NM88_9CUCU
MLFENVCSKKTTLAEEPCKIIESAQIKSENMGTSADVQVAAVQQKKWQSNGNYIQNCRNCGRSHKLNNCPAYRKECKFCKARNHFEKMYRKKK